MLKIFKKYFKKIFFINNLSSIITFINFIIIAKFLNPEIFGQYSLLLAWNALIFIFFSYGETEAIIRENKNLYDQVNSQLFIKTSLCLISIFFIFFIDLMNFEPIQHELRLHFYLIFFSHIIAQYFSVYDTYNLKNKYFLKIIYINFFSKILSNIILLILVFYGFGLISLTLYIFFEKTFFSIFLFISSERKFLPKFQKKLLIEFFHFSKFIFIQNLSNKSYSHIYAIFINKYFGFEILGIYNRALSMVSNALLPILNPVKSIMYPHFGDKLNSNLKLNYLFKFNFLLISFLLCNLIILFYFFIIVIIEYYLGPNWLELRNMYLLISPFIFFTFINQFLNETNILFNLSKKLVLFGLPNFLLVIVLIIFFNLTNFKFLIFLFTLNSLLSFLFNLYLLNVFLKSNLIFFFIKVLATNIIPILIFSIIIYSGSDYNIIAQLIAYSLFLIFFTLFINFKKLKKYSKYFL